MRLFTFAIQVVFTFTALCVHGNDLEDLLLDNSSTETDCVDLIKSEAGQAISYKSSYIPIAMRKGFWLCAKEIIALAQQAGNDVRNIFDLESRLIMKEIAGLKAAVESSQPISSITPAFQWAQSPNEIFINVKFAHKLDAPATLNVEANNVSIDGSRLFLHASDGRKNFVLDMDLLRDIKSDESSWSMASVGRMVFTLKKQDAPSKWTRLLRNQRKIANMHSWWELIDKHRDELDRLDETDSDEDETDNRTVKKPKILTDTSLPESGTANTGIIETPEMAAKSLEKSNIEIELKHQIKLLEDELKKKKRDIDSKARAEKNSLDTEYKTKKIELENKASNDTEALELKGNTSTKTEL